MAISKQKKILATLTFTSWMLILGFQNCSQNPLSQNERDPEVTDSELLNEGRAVLESNLLGSSNVGCTAEHGGSGYYPTNSDPALGTDRLKCVILTCDQGFVPKGDQCVPLDQQPEHDAKVTYYYYEPHLLEKQISRVEVTVVNTGTLAWNPGKGYRLMLQETNCDKNIWGVQTVAIKSEVLPGQSYTFNFSVKAPKLERLNDCRSSGVPMLENLLSLDWTMSYQASKSKPREPFGSGTASLNCLGDSCFGNQVTIHKPEPLKTGCVDISNDQTKTSYFCFDGKSFYGFKPKEPGNLNEGIINDGENAKELSTNDLEKLNKIGKTLVYKSYKLGKVNFKLYSSKLVKWISGTTLFDLIAEVTPAALGEWQVNFRTSSIPEYDIVTTANIRKIVRFRSSSIGDLPPPARDPEQHVLPYIPDPAPVPNPEPNPKPNPEPVISPIHPSPLYDCKVEFNSTGAGAQVSSSTAQVGDADSCLKYAVDASVSNGYIKSIIFKGDPLKIPFKDCIIDISTTTKSESKTIKEFYNNSQCLKFAMEMASKSITGSNLNSFIVKMADTTLSYVKSGISTTVMKSCTIKLKSLDDPNTNTVKKLDDAGSIGSCLISALGAADKKYESVLQIEFDGRIILDVNGVN